MMKTNPKSKNVATTKDGFDFYWNWNKYVERVVNKHKKALEYWYNRQRNNKGIWNKRNNSIKTIN